MRLLTILIVCLLCRSAFPQQGETLVLPGLLEKEALQAGNPLATYAAMLDLEKQYRQSKIFAGVYPEIRFNFEEFLGFPNATTEALSLPAFKSRTPSVETPFPVDFTPRSALWVIERESAKTKAVIFGEEHHSPQTRSLYEGMLRMLWKKGYRYLAAESFDDSVMCSDLHYPTYASGLYTHDPVYASAFRVARDLGYKLISYDTNERGPNSDQSFRDRTQAEIIKKRVFDVDPEAKVLIFAGRGHAAEVTAQDGWTPMASVLKNITGINPLTVYAPTMTERSSREEENPLYLYATRLNLVREPTIFVSKKSGHLLGSESFDAYVFWPRLKIDGGRPDWMRTTLKRKRAPIPNELRKGQAPYLVQAFREGEPADAIPVDQVLIVDRSNIPALMLPKGRFWIRTIDRNSVVRASKNMSVR